ncbi:MAG: division/cell wall cluster transcriptional repressor MraZ [Chloroflexales bacterium]|nr:division/cell wall cluster transcriptional repressor MraZ [Chloroflexales bacterium]
MGIRIEVELDDQGRLVLPISFAHHLGLGHGAMLVVEDETADATYLRIQKAEPTIVEEGGVLVITAVADQSLEAVLWEEREQHFDDVWEGRHAHLA